MTQDIYAVIRDKVLHDRRLRVRIASVLSLIVLVACTAPASAPQAAGNDGRTYRRMLDAALANPQSVDFVALRQAYAASPAYDPFVGSTAEDKLMVQAMNANAWQRAATLADAAIAKNAMNVRAQLFAAKADHGIGRLAEGDAHLAFAIGDLRAIASTGNGDTQQTAMHVLATSEEYMVLDLLQLRSQRQALVQSGGHSYDVLSTVSLLDGSKHDMYFNVDVSLARETAIATGAVKPVSQNDLPR